MVGHPRKLILVWEVRVGTFATYQLTDSFYLAHPTRFERVTFAFKGLAGVYSGLRLSTSISCNH